MLVVWLLVMVMLMVISLGLLASQLLGNLPWVPLHILPAGAVFSSITHFHSPIESIFPDFTNGLEQLTGILAQSYHRDGIGVK